MAAPKRNRTNKNDPLYQKTLDKIEVGQLVNRLEKNALGKLYKNSGKVKDEDYVEIPIEMSAGQIRSAEILLSKKLPNLSAVDATTKGDKITQPVINLNQGAKEDS